MSVNLNPTHPGGRHSFLPGGRSSRLFRGTTPIAACMIVMNFLNFIFHVSSDSIPGTVTAAPLSSPHPPPSHRMRSLFSLPLLGASVSPWQQASAPAQRSATSPCRGHHGTNAHTNLSLRGSDGHVLLAPQSAARVKRGKQKPPRWLLGGGTSLT